MKSNVGQSLQARPRDKAPIFSGKPEAKRKRSGWMERGTMDDYGREGDSPSGQINNLQII